MTPTLYLEKTDSTNQYLINLIESDQVKEGLAVFCFNQTKGKGQKGNTWISEPGKNVCYSIFIKPDYIPVRNQFIISQVISLATKAFLEEFSGNISIKWPNDIYWNDKKIAGILIENKLKKDIIEYSVIGIGVNINQIQFPKNLPNPVSLSQITGDKYDLNEIANKLHHKIRTSLEELNLGTEGDIQRYYVNSLYHRDGFHSYRSQNGDFSAKIRGVSALGYLMLEHEDGNVKNYAFKEIEYL